MRHVLSESWLRVWAAALILFLTIAAHMGVIALIMSFIPALTFWQAAVIDAVIWLSAVIGVSGAFRTFEALLVVLLLWMIAAAIIF